MATRVPQLSAAWLYYTGAIGTGVGFWRRIFNFVTLWLVGDEIYGKGSRKVKVPRLNNILDCSSVRALFIKTRLLNLI
jgi:hypothetical protein